MSKAALEKEKEHVEDFAPEVGGVSLVCVRGGVVGGCCHDEGRVA